MGRLGGVLRGLYPERTAERPRALLGGFDTCALSASKKRHGLSAQAPAYPTPTRAVTAMRGLLCRGTT
jgi:hypothetical protein